jgi:outer membrane lipoprotein LolB
LKNARHLFSLLSWLILASCATSPTVQQTVPSTAVINPLHLAKLSAIKNFGLKGRLGVVTQKQGFSGGIDWQHKAITDNIDVFSPFGGKIANIAKNANGVTLTNQDGHSIKAQDTESLTEATLGFKLPLTGLSDWAIGRPTASKIESSSIDAQGRLLTLKQDGWDISYENYTDYKDIANNAVSLPNKIVLKSEKVNLKLLIEKFTSH